MTDANRHLDEWKKQYGALSGGVRVWTGDPNRPPPFEVVGSDPVVAARVIEHAKTVFPPPTKNYRPRYRWLTWLFNLVSVEEWE